MSTYAFTWLIKYKGFMWFNIHRTKAAYMVRFFSLVLVCLFSRAHTKCKQATIIKS